MAGRVTKRPSIMLLGREAATPASLRRLYLDHFAELCRTVRRKYGAGPPEPEDVAQAAFAKYAALPDRDRVENPRAFLFRMAHNIVVDEKRLQDRRAAHASDEQYRQEGEGRADFSPERVFIGKEEFLLVEAALKAMPARDRRLFLLHRVEGLSYAEIARREKCSESGVRKAVKRALAACHEAVRATKPDYVQEGDR